MNKKGLFSKEDNFSDLLFGEKLLGMILIAVALWLSYRAELVKVEFLIGVLVLMESVACFRTGRWIGSQQKAVQKKEVQPAAAKNGK